MFDRRTEELGATTDAAKADLIEVDRVTMWRYRKGHLSPSLDRAITIANRLGISLTDLIEQVPAS